MLDRVFFKTIIRWLVAGIFCDNLIQMKSRILFVILLTIQLLLLNPDAKACSLAVHDWHLVFYTKIPLKAPFFPLAELNFLNANFKEKAADKILWVADHGPASVFLSDLISAFPTWPASATWSLISDQSSVLEHARRSMASKNPPLVIGSDQNFLKIALFSDANSDYNCHQAVVMVSNRIRGVLLKHDQPWAQEMNGMAWVSLIFLQVPIPGRILSLSVFPVDYARRSLFEDHDYVEHLLGLKLLRRRPDLEIDPFVFDFPELPD